MDLVKELNGTFLTHDVFFKLRTEKEELEKAFKKRQLEKKSKMIKLRIFDKNDFTQMLNDRIVSEENHIFLDQQRAQNEKNEIKKEKDQLCQRKKQKQEMIKREEQSIKQEEQSINNA
jgi:hypothetical protein